MDKPVGLKFASIRRSIPLIHVPTCDARLISRSRYLGD
ncbi:hypothetical protein NIES2104_60840 [Leptolyngbya sp. NIES-2104]|nr:hypothetical protein NIES2104_60840 [Leptolyngbya sp. NIES-2104]